MEEHYLIDNFSPAAGQEYVAAAAYFESMDCIEYVKQDMVVISDRIDKFLTIIRNEKGDVVGFKLKGIKNFFLTQLKAAFKLTDQEFVYVRDFFVALATKMGDDLFSNDRVKEEAYRSAAAIAANDNVKLTISRSLAA